MVLGATDWALKRFLKLVLKKNLGRYLKSELDINELDVELSSGSLSLRNALLNVDTINDTLVSHVSDTGASHDCVKKLLPED